MDRRGSAIITEKPHLKRPHMVLGISGWVDGGLAATGSVEYLVNKLGARKFAEIPVSRFHIYQVPGQLVLRPYINIEEGILTHHRFSENVFYYWINPDEDHDLILFWGTEPNLNWEEYADSILGVVEEYSVDRIYLLGGVLDRTPHTREPVVSCACSSKELKEEMGKYNVQYTNYEGPGRFGTTLLYMCQQEGKPMVALTTRVTYYPEFNILIPRNPKSIRSIMKRLEPLLHLPSDISDLDRECAEFEEKLNYMMSKNAELQAYVKELEKDVAEVPLEESLDMSGDEAVRLAEEFLKEKKDE